MRRVVYLLPFLFLLFFLIRARAEDVLSPRAEISKPGASIVVGLDAGTNPQGAEPLLACMGRHVAVRKGETYNGTVADYLSRFYKYTDAFHKARRCDSFLLRHAEASPDDPGWYHVAVFTYDDAGQVERVRRLEAKGDGHRRIPATENTPGLLLFKGPPERYRVFFLDKRIVFFFWVPPIPSSDAVAPYGEDAKLRDAALNLLDNCLKR